MKKSEKSEKKEEKVALVLLDIVSDTRTSTAVQGVRALGQVHTSLSPERNTVLGRTGKKCVSDNQKHASKNTPKLIDFFLVKTLS